MGPDAGFFSDRDRSIIVENLLISSAENFTDLLGTGQKDRSTKVANRYFSN